MNKYINQLLQLQDMVLALCENDILHCDAENAPTLSKEIEKNIQEMKALLPADIVYKMERLNSKGGLFVVPMINDVCHGCFMKIPVAVGHNVRNNTQCVNCPSCDRFLYEDYHIQRDNDNAHYKGIARFSSVVLMIPEIEASDHADAIAEMAELTYKAGFVEDEKEFVDALMRREAMASTAVGYGLAFPHARGVHAGGLTLTVGVSKKGVDFGDGGGHTNIVFMSAVPTPASMFYMEMVSKLARHFGDPTRAERLTACSSPEEMWKVIVKIGR